MSRETESKMEKTRQEAQQTKTKTSTRGMKETNTEPAIGPKTGNPPKSRGRDYRDEVSQTQITNET